MAQVLPAKRSYGFTDGHRASVDGIAGPNRSKRRRISAEPSERNYAEDIESPYPEDEEVPSRASDNEEDERDFVRATQIVEKSFRRKTNQENIPAEAGIIEEIRCTNFMCHDQLTVTLGPLINFIIGENGSGKSAVLTALTLCLGGKTTATNRGQNLKAFIKEGREFCTLSVKLKNQGSMAYKPEQYGDSIFAERHFNRSGTSGFKLKDRNGKIVSTKKAELEDIVDAFALQLDNPMNVLTQDQARQFLNQSNPKEKYKFFLKGTQLENLNNDYKQIEHELEEQEAKAQTLLGDLAVFRKNYEQARAKAIRAGGLEKLRVEEYELLHQAAWAEVEGEEQELDRNNTDLERISRLIEERKTEANTESEKFDLANQALNNARQELQECQAKVQSAKEEVDECKAKFEENKRVVMKHKSDERQILGQIKTAQKTVTETQSQIQDHKERQAGADNGIHAQKMQEWDEAKTSYEERKAAWERHDEALPALNKQMADARDQRQQADGRLLQKRNEEAASRTKIRALEQGQRKWIDSYPNPPMLEKLLRAIENEGRFREAPVGPIGRYVELLKPEWGSILEKSFGSTLNAFVVTSKGDHTILSEMMRRHNYQVPILIGRNDSIDTAANEPDKELLTWMRVLKISNQLVRNQLIINQGIDQVVLIPKRNDATDFMNSAGPHRINVKMCFCMSDSSRRQGHVIIANQQTNTTSLGPIEEYRGQHRMQADESSQIQDEKDNLANIQREIRDIEAGARAAQDQLNSCQSRIQSHMKQKRQLKLQMDRAHDDVGRLEDEVNACTPDAAQIEELERELAVAQERVEMDEKQYDDFIIHKDKADNDARSLKSQLDEATKVLHEAEFQYDKLGAKVHTLTHRREQALRRKNAMLEEVEDAEKNKIEWETKCREQQATVTEKTKLAMRVCARVQVPPNETVESLQRKYENKKQTREAAELELGGSEEELLTIANDAKKAYFDAQNMVKGTENVRRVLKLALQTRQERWRRFRQAISMRARVTFNYLLSERRFRGSLSIDHKNQRLDIHIQPDITVKEDAGRQTKTLSGGEKSFSTICLLLALWDAMGSPIRCLDEFDVYMDQANRDVTMKLIIGAARRSVGRQYILITPQAISNAVVGNADDVKIILLASPERGQTALNFSG